MSEANAAAIIIGAGPAGLAVGATLGRAGVPALVVDRATAVGASWRSHYDRLHLHTERRLSGLPGLPIPPRYGKWVPRAQVVEYLEDYARHHALRLRLGTLVKGLRREGPRWRLTTADGELVAPFVVVATGYNHTPHLPEWPGLKEYRGELVHSAVYRNAEPYRRRDVLVVGTGNSGAEIAVDLCEGDAARVRVAVRTPPNIMLREAGGISTQQLGVLLRHAPAALLDPLSRLIQRLTIGDLSRYGLPASKVGPYTRAMQGQIPILDVGFVDALKAGRLSIVPAVQGFSATEVLLSDGTSIRPDAVIACTGYRRGLETLVGHLGVLAENGLPLTHGPRTHPAAPGLHFIGYTNPISGNFRELGIDAERIASAIAEKNAAAAGRS